MIFPMIPVPFEQIRKNLSLLYCVVKSIVRVSAVRAKTLH